MQISYLAIGSRVGKTEARGNPGKLLPFRVDTIGPWTLYPHNYFGNSLSDTGVQKRVRQGGHLPASIVSWSLYYTSRHRQRPESCQKRKRELKSFYHLNLPFCICHIHISGAIVDFSKKKERRDININIPWKAVAAFRFHTNTLSEMLYKLFP